MAIYVYVTDACEHDAQNYNQVSLVAGLQKSIEKTQNLTDFQFLRTVLLKKPLGRHFRLIAYRASVANDELILFLAPRRVAP